jgi:hypothetical protein
VILGEGREVLALDGMGCRGDGSVNCCYAPAYGQDVQAEGRLEPLRGGAGDPRWMLAAPVLCAESDVPSGVELSLPPELQ